MTVHKRRRPAADPDKNPYSKPVPCLRCRKVFVSRDTRHNRLCDCCLGSGEFRSDASVAVFASPERK